MDGNLISIFLSLNLEVGSVAEIDASIRATVELRLPWLPTASFDPVSNPNPFGVPGFSDLTDDGFYLMYRWLGI